MLVEMYFFLVLQTGKFVSDSVEDQTEQVCSTTSFANNLFQRIVEHVKFAVCVCMKTLKCISQMRVNVSNKRCSDLSF